MIHESSPGGVSSDYIKEKCRNYSYSYFFPDTELGSFEKGARCENLESMTFENEQFDIFITQGVFEHVNRPSLAFREISRVLKPGGMHIFTVPLCHELEKTRPRIVIKEPVKEVISSQNMSDTKSLLEREDNIGKNATVLFLYTNNYVLVNFFPSFYEINYREEIRPYILDIFAWDSSFPPVRLFK